MAEGEKREQTTRPHVQSPGETGQSSEALGLGLSPSLPLGWGFRALSLLGSYRDFDPYRVEDRPGLAKWRRGADTFLPLEQSLELSLVLGPES